MSIERWRNLYIFTNSDWSFYVFYQCSILPSLQPTVLMQPSQRSPRHHESSASPQLNGNSAAAAAAAAAHAGRLPPPPPPPIYSKYLHQQHQNRVVRSNGFATVPSADEMSTELWKNNYVLIIFEKLLQYYYWLLLLSFERILPNTCPILTPLPNSMCSMCSTLFLPFVKSVYDCDVIWI